MSYIPLKTKYISGICCLILLVAALLLAYMYQQFNSQIERELQKRGESIARSLAAQAITPILTENNIALQLLLRETDRNEPDTRYIYIADHHGNVLAHSLEHSFPTGLHQPDIPQKTTGDLYTRHLNTDEGLIIDVAAPIYTGKLGWIHVGMSEGFINQELNKILLKGMPIIAVILIGSIIAALWFAAKITEPLANLSEKVKKVGLGEFDGEIEEVTNDEVGELSHTYNIMIRQLRELRTEQMDAELELRMQAAMLEEEVAERQEAQQQLKSLNLDLEERVNKAVQELRRKDKMMILQGRQAAMGEMINNIAHQWRQPINNLGLIVQGMKLDYDHQEMTTEQMDESVDNIMKTIKFMSQTINDFSSFFNADRDRSSFSISNGLEKVILMMESSLFAKGINLQVEQQEDVIIEGFYNEYKQVLLNLLNNARDVLVERNIENPSIKVIILREGANAVLKVKDNAGGIPGDVIGRVFDPYFTTKENGKGSGIGLYMSRMIIHEHFGGNLSARNIDTGAEFTVSTPCP